MYYKKKLKMENEKDKSTRTSSSPNTECVFHLNKTYSIEYVLSHGDICINQINEFSWRNDLVPSGSLQKISSSKLRDHIRMLSNDLDSLSEVAIVCKSNISQYEAIYSIEEAVNAGSLLNDKWFVPGMIHWKKILMELLDAEIRDDGSIYFRDYDIYTQKKKTLNLSGKYWIYPASYTDKVLLYIDFDKNCVSGVDVSAGQKCKVRPIKMNTIYLDTKN